MNLKIFSYITLFVLAIGLSSCHDGIETGKDTGERGQVHLMSLSIDITNAENIFNTSTGSRATVDMSQFKVEIIDIADNSTMNKWDFNEMPEIFELPVGDYKAVVYNTMKSNADWDAPLFKGESTFTIEANKICDIDKVVCKLANIKVSIRYTNQLSALLEKDINVDVTMAGDKLTFTHGETRSAYFKGSGDSNNLIVHFKGTVNGHLEEHHLSLTGVAPGQHRIITYGIKNNEHDPGNETGTVDPNGIEIDADVDTENLSADVNNEEPNLGGYDEPGKEDPDPNEGDDPNPPTENTIVIDSETLSFDQPNSTDISPAVVNIKAPKGITHFRVKISSDNEGFIGAAGEMVPLDFDLAYPANDEDAEKLSGSLGFPVRNDVIGKTELDFDITQFLPLLGAFAGTHSFELTIEDGDNKSNTKTLVFVVK